MRTHAPVTLLGDALPLALDDEVAEVLQLFGKTHQRGGGFFLKFATVGGVYQGGIPRCRVIACTRKRPRKILKPTRPNGARLSPPAPGSHPVLILEF